MMPAALAFHERLIVILFGAILLILCVHSLINSQFSHPLEVEQLTQKFDEMVEVAVEGAVRYPGVYKFPVKSQIKDLLEIAEPLALADCKGLKPGKLLKQGQRFVVKEKPLKKRALQVVDRGENRRKKAKD